MKEMKKTLLILALAATVGQLSAQKVTSWKKVAAGKASGLERIRQVAPTEEENLYQVDVNVLRQALRGVGGKFSGKEGVVIQIPNTNGVMERYQVWENSNFEAGTQVQDSGKRGALGERFYVSTA